MKKVKNLYLFIRPFGCTFYCCVKYPDYLTPVSVSRILAVNFGFGVSEDFIKLYSYRTYEDYKKSYMKIDLSLYLDAVGSGVC